MKVAIMQPYFLPYIGYYQLIAAVDLFILYDNIKYTKKGWFNRNRMLQNGKEVMFSLPLKSGSDYLNVCERELSTAFNRDKLLNQFRGAYHRAPYFSQTFALVEEIIRHENTNLFKFLRHAIVKTCAHLGINTEIRNSSDVAIDHSLKNQDKVLALCKAVNAKTYVNSIGGLNLYSAQVFRSCGLNLMFIRPRSFEYAQLGNGFVPWLSIVDVLMFNPQDRVQTCIHSHYDVADSFVTD
ncbi:MAG: WbqC family protein [Rhodoferax sp.]|nr:WbqC family protein [Rhodoferax sp.]